MARELKAPDWRLESVITDNGSEFRSKVFGQGVDELGVRQRRIRAGRPTSNGNVERLEQMILELCWRAVLRPLVPKPLSLEQDLRPRPHRPADARKECRRTSSTVPT